MKSFFAYVVWAVISGPLGLSDTGFISASEEPALFATPSVQVQHRQRASKTELSGGTSMGGILVSGQQLAY
jgi:membrane protein required for beta-lactamase induction